MVRELKEVGLVAEGNGVIGNGALFLLMALVSFCVLCIIVFSCAEGAKDKVSATDHAAYGSTCAAGCGAACGA
ncbi:hypothetical protein ACLOJK_001265 [Asimina triloba]